MYLSFFVIVKEKKMKINNNNDTIGIHNDVYDTFLLIIPPFDKYFNEPKSLIFYWGLVHRVHE